MVPAHPRARDDLGHVDVGSAIADIVLGCSRHPSTLAPDIFEDHTTDRPIKCMFCPRDPSVLSTIL